MDLNNPFRASAGGPVQQVKLPTVSPREYGRLYIMFGAFAFLIVAMLALKVWMQKETAREERRNRLVTTGVRPESAAYKLSVRLRELCTPLRDGDEPIDAAALAAVSGFVAKELPGDRIAELANARLNPTALLVDPPGGRGVVLKLKLQVEAVSRAQDRILVDGKAAGSGLPLRLVAPLEAKPGDWIDTHGIFLRAESAAPGRLVFLAGPMKEGLPPQDASASPAPTAGPEAKAWSDEEAREQFRRLASKFGDGPEQIGVKVDRDSPEFLAVAQALVASVPPEQATRLSRNVKPKELAQEPGKFRGEFVRLRGRLIYIFTNPVSVTTPLGLRELYEGYLADMENPQGQKVPVTFYMATKPEGKFTTAKTRSGEEYFTDWVDVEGVFLRLYRYEGTIVEADQRVPVNTAPVLLVRNLRILPPEAPAKTSYGFGWVVSGTALLLIVIILFGGWMTRRHGGERTLRMELAKGRRDRPVPPPGGGAILGEEVKPPPPPAPPAP